MTRQNAAEVAVAMCLERAAKSQNPMKAQLLLYAAIIPAYMEWEDKHGIITTDISIEDYVAAIVGCCATLAAQCVKTVTADDPAKIDQLGPGVTAFFAKVFQHTCYSAETVVGFTGRGDS